MADPAHEVVVLCDCGDIEDCRMERYVSDVRILLLDLDEHRGIAADTVTSHRGIVRAQLDPDPVTI